MTDQTIPLPAADTPAPASDIAVPQTADAKPDAGHAETGDPTASSDGSAEVKQDEDTKKEPTKAELRRKERNRERWAELQAKARRADYYEAQYREASQAKDPDWNSFVDPHEEVAERVLNKLRKEQVPQLERKAEDARNEVEQTRRAAFQEAVEDARTRYPDYDAVVFSKDARYPDEIVPYVASSENGADVAYYLGKNPDVARQLMDSFQMSPMAGFIELGRIEAQMSRPTQKTVSMAPKPPSPISGGSSPPGFDAASASVSETESFLRKAGIIR